MYIHVLSDIVAITSLVLLPCVTSATSGFVMEREILPQVTSSLTWFVRVIGSCLCIEKGPLEMPRWNVILNFKHVDQYSSRLFLWFKECFHDGVSDFQLKISCVVLPSQY